MFTVGEFCSQGKNILPFENQFLGLLQRNSKEKYSKTNEGANLLLFCFSKSITNYINHINSLPLQQPSYAVYYKMKWDLRT